MKQKNISLIDKFIGKLIIHEYKKNDIIYLIILSERDGRKDLYDVWDVTGGGYSLLPKSTVEDLYKANKLEVIG